MSDLNPTELKQRARNARRQGNLREAFRLYDNAVDLSRRTESPEQLAHTLRHLADIQRELGQTEDALESAGEVIRIYRKSKAVSGLELANAVRVWALCQQADGDAMGARTAWGEARGLYERAGMEAGVRECDVRLAEPV